MKEFDVILEECIDQMTRGASSLDQCLTRYPEHAARLRPLLRAAVRVEAGRDVKPSPAFKARARVQLNEHMGSHPRSQHRMRPFWKMAISMAALVLAFFITGTTFAQGALPGDGLYGWKLGSERVWRTVSFDRLETDLRFAQRRVDEMVAVSGDEIRVIQALEGYKVLLTRFEADGDTLDQQRILPVLQSQRDSLAQAGFLIPELDNYFLSDSQVDDNGLPLPSTTEVTPPDSPSLPTPEPPSH